MYKTVVTTDKHYDKNIQLHKNYRTHLQIPGLFKLSTGTTVVIIATATLLSIFISIHFLWLLCALFAVGMITTGLIDIEGFDFWPERTDASDEHVGATQGVQHRLLSQLHDAMQYEEVDNFSNRQDLAAEIFNLIKVHRVDKSLADEGELIKAAHKLMAVENEAKRQRKEIKRAGLHAETPALDLAADVVGKTD